MSNSAARAPHGILLDIEGTTSSIAFVAEVLFPFVRRELAKFLADRWDEPAVQTACQQIGRDAGRERLESREEVAAEVLSQMDRDAKLNGLKQLQGLIWEAGFSSGELRAQVFPDVPPALAAWRAAGIDRRIYSSGSVQAQRLFFGHSEHGDLLPFFSGHYDTAIGGKKESASYASIARDWGLAPGEILFASDIEAELAAARQAGLEVSLCCRPGNAPASAECPFRKVTSFAELVQR